MGKMIKDLFHLVREIRILDERLGYYKDRQDMEKQGRDSAEITLKGIYVDMAEGGSKNQSSVFGMARELQFTSLPDLFFIKTTSSPVSSHIYSSEGSLNQTVKVFPSLSKKTFTCSIFFHLPLYYQ